MEKRNKLFLYLYAFCRTLARVEEFVDNLKFTRYSDYSQQTNRQRNVHISNAQKLCKDSEFATKVPFAGPDYDNVCKNFTYHSSHHDDDKGRRLSKVLHRYEPVNNEDPRIFKLRKRSKLAKKINAFMTT